MDWFLPDNNEADTWTDFQSSVQLLRQVTMENRRRSMILTWMQRGVQMTEARCAEWRAEIISLWFWSRILIWRISVKAYCLSVLLKHPSPRWALT